MRLKRPEGMNIIPFIDIMLVLLAITLTLSTFLHQTALPIELPRASHSQNIEPNKFQEITLYADGTIHLNAQIINLETLKERIKTLNPETPITLKADTTIAFGDFINVVDLLKNLQMHRINILVTKPL